MTAAVSSDPTKEPDAGYQRLRHVLSSAIETCPKGEEHQLRLRITQFAAGLDPDDLTIFERVVSDLNEGPDVRIERELADLLADFITNRPEPSPPA